MAVPAGDLAQGHRTWRYRVYTMLDGEGRTPGSAVVRTVMVIAIVLNAAAVVLATVKSLSTSYHGLFAAIDNATLVLFALDYMARIWAAPEDESMASRTPWSARRAYLLSPLGVIDLVALLPLCLEQFMRGDSDWFRVLRLIAMLKITRHAPALQLFVAVIRNESRVLLSALLAMTVNWALVSAIIFALEHESQPDVFSSMPQAMWWAIVTMATVGYGDIVPISPAGRIFGGIVMVLGIASVAVPAGILATGFATELRKRRSMLSWQLVAKVPLFAHLEASRIAAIARLLKLDVLPPRYTIILRGEPGDAMFFIVSGEVEVQIEPQPARLGPGQYFGEIALLREVPRTATIVSVTECELLVLSAADFRRLLQEYPALGESIREVAERRVGQGRRDSTQ
ncbi:MAG: cyclic nucleotide-gated ion channel [Betaproteobacteria bacterium]